MIPKNIKGILEEHFSEAIIFYTDKKNLSNFHIIRDGKIEEVSSSLKYLFIYAQSVLETMSALQSDSETNEITEKLFELGMIPENLEPEPEEGEEGDEEDDC